MNQDSGSLYGYSGMVFGFGILIDKTNHLRNCRKFEPASKKLKRFLVR